MEKGPCGWKIMPLAAEHQLLAAVASEKAFCHLLGRGVGEDMARAVAENAAICTYCLCRPDGSRAFLSVWQVLGAMTLEEIAGYAQAYDELVLGGYEWGYNQQWEEKADAPTERDAPKRRSV